MARASTTSNGDVASIDAVRAFNRFYGRHLGLPCRGLDDSGWSPTEIRAMDELAGAPGRGASQLARTLALDAGYVSRLLKKLEAAGLVRRTPSAVDRRQSLLALTARGTRLLAEVEAATRDRIGGLLATVRSDRRGTLVDAMRTIRGILEPDAAATPAAYLIRGPGPGDLGWVIHRQAVLYTREYGWNAEFEGLLAQIVASFVAKFDPAFEHCWIAECDGAVAGSVFVVRKSARVAQLRMLFVEPASRGLGIGARLVDACIVFARGCGYRTMVLWTNGNLDSARRIYQAAGFALVRSENHRSFGKDLVGQYWSLKL